MMLLIPPAAVICVICDICEKNGHSLESGLEDFYRV